MAHRRIIKRHTPRYFLLVTVNINIARSNGLFVTGSLSRRKRSERSVAREPVATGIDTLREADRLLPPETPNCRYQSRSISLCLGETLAPSRAPSALA